MLTILHHLGLGDHIICNGLIRHYANTNQIKTFCKNKNHINISQMYSDNNNIIIQPVDNNINPNNIQLEKPYLKIGFEHLQSLNRWDKAFYDQINLDFQASWELFKINRNIDKENEVYEHLNPENKPYIFVHDTSIGQSVPKLNLDGFIIRPEKYGFFDYLKIIENAAEIHCVNSSYVHLVDRVKTNGKLFYHSNKQPIDLITLRKDWIR